MNTRKILFLIACLCVSTAMHAQIRLSFNPTVGETLSYRFVTEQSIVQNVMGQTIPMNTTMDIAMTMTATESNDDAVHLDIIYDAFTMQVTSPTMPMMNTNIDSRANDGGVMSDIFNTMMNTTLSVVIGRDGRVQSISGLDAFNQLDSSNPAIAAFQGSFNESALKTMLEQSFNVYPTNPVNIGDSWDHTINMTMQGMNSTTSTTYTLRAVNGNIASIDLLTAMSITSADPNMSGEMSGEMTGEKKLDINTGMVITSTMGGTVSGTLSVGGMMEIGSEITTTVSVTLE